jgi:hypothetical protein
MRIVTVGIEEKGGTIPLKVNGIVKLPKDQNDGNHQA